MTKILFLILTLLTKTALSGVEWLENTEIQFSQTPVSSHECPKNSVEVDKEYFIKELGEETGLQYFQHKHKTRTFHSVYRPLEGNELNPSLLKNLMLEEMTEEWNFMEEMKFQNLGYKTIAEGTVDAAKRMHDYFGYNDTVIFLGRSPSPLRYIVEKLEESPSLKEIRLISASFSGHPGISKSMRSLEDGSAQAGCHSITREGLEWYFSYLDSLEIVPKAESSSTIWLVDILGRGSALGAFLKILDAYQKSRGASLLDKVKFLFPANSRFYNEATDEIKYGDYKFYHKGKSYTSFIKIPKWSYKQGTLTLTPTEEMKKNGFPAFTIDAQAFPIPERLLAFLDNNFRKIGASYKATGLSACAWQDEIPNTEQAEGEHWPMVRNALHLALLTTRAIF